MFITAVDFDIALISEVWRAKKAGSCITSHTWAAISTSSGRWTSVIIGISKFSFILERIKIPFFNPGPV